MQKRRYYKRLFVDAGKIIGTFGMGIWWKYYHGYKLEGGVNFLHWYLEFNLYRNKQQLAELID